MVKLPLRALKFNVIDTPSQYRTKQMHCAVSTVLTLPLQTLVILLHF